jgi:hypothetical protein
MAITRVLGSRPSIIRSGSGLVPALVLVMVALASRGMWLGDPVADFDEQLYSFIGWRMTQGDLPYVDAWDRKPFGLFLIFAVAHWLFGPEPVAYQALAFLSVLSGAWLVYLLSLRLVDRTSSTIAAALYLLLLAAYGSYSAQSEVFHTPLMALMCWLVVDPNRPDAVKRAFAAILVGGIALQIKYTVLPQCVFFGAWSLYCRWRAGVTPMRLVPLAASFSFLGLLPTALVAALYASKGQFGAFWFANFVSFFDREPSQFGRFWPGHLSGAIPMAAIIALGLYAALRLSPPRDRKLFAFYTGWGLAAFASVMMPATTYLYYYGALAAPAVLIALPLIDRNSPGRLVPAGALVAGLLLIVNPPERLAHSLGERRAEARLSGAIAPFVNSDQCLYVFDGPTALYRTTDSCLPSRFIYPDHLNNALERKALGISQTREIRRILDTRPGVIVTAALPVTIPCQECLALVTNAVGQDYRPIITISQHNRAITAWARRDLAP